MDGLDSRAEAVRRDGAAWRATPREQSEQAAARAGALIARWFEAPHPDRRDLERARDELAEALELSGG